MKKLTYIFLTCSLFLGNLISSEILSPKNKSFITYKTGYQVSALTAINLFYNYAKKKS